jgi:hypothetical protein
MYNTHNTNQFEVFNYENTTINDNYFQKKYILDLNLDTLLNFSRKKEAKRNS